jgi:hypothetical protein
LGLFLDSSFFDSQLSELKFLASSLFL